MLNPSSRTFECPSTTFCFGRQIHRTVTIGMIVVLSVVTAFILVVSVSSSLRAPPSALLSPPTHRPHRTPQWSFVLLKKHTALFDLFLFSTAASHDQPPSALHFLRFPSQNYRGWAESGGTGTAKSRLRIGHTSCCWRGACCAPHCWHCMQRRSTTGRLLTTLARCLTSCCTWCRRCCST